MVNKDSTAEGLVHRPFPVYVRLVYVAAVTEQGTSEFVVLTLLTIINANHGGWRVLFHLLSDCFCCYPTALILCLAGSHNI